MGADLRLRLSVVGSFNRASVGLGYNGFADWGSRGSRFQTQLRGKSFMAQNHYVTKTKRRVKNPKRKDPSAATMAKLRKLAAADKK